MATNSTSQTKNENEGQIGCEACIKKDKIIADLYEALKFMTQRYKTIEPLYSGDRQAIEKADEALAKAEGVK